MEKIFWNTLTPAERQAALRKLPEELFMELDVDVHQHAWEELEPEDRELLLDVEDLLRG